MLSDQKRQDLIDALASEPRFLGRIRNKRIKPYEEEVIEKFELDAYKKEGYELVPSRHKNKIKVVKYKEHSIAFENKIWCLMYDLGFRMLNKNDKFILPYGTNGNESQQIDVVAINDDVVILIECKSSKKLVKKDHRPYIDTLQKKISGFKQSINELVGPRKVKFIFATNNQDLGKTNIDILSNSNAFYLNNSGQNYLRSLIESYKSSAHYQFMSMIFKGEILKKDKIRIPAIKGKMGGNTYYMFSIEPEFLLKIGFVLHRVKANEEDFPTYQRLLDKKRIKSLSEFINSGGYFPNSVIINFETKKQKGPRRLEWEKSGQKDDSVSDHGILKIPNSYGIAYIIDGQHRVYGYSYAESEYKSSQTIPVVAFENLEKTRQLEMFMEINENQKAISRDLKETLKEDLYWTEEKVSLKMQALMSGINNYLGSDNGYQISRFLSIGEDKKEITMGTVIDGIKDSGFLPSVVKGEMIDNDGVIYKIGVQDHKAEMQRVKISVGKFIAEAFEYVIKEFDELWKIKGGLIRSSRGAYAFIRTLGELNSYLSKAKKIDKMHDSSKRFSVMKKYIRTLMLGLQETQNNESELLKIKKAYGAGNKKIWNHLYTSILNKKFNDFITPEYKVHLETQNEDIQNEANQLIVSIESIVRNRTLSYVYAKCGGKEFFKEEYYELFNELREKAERAEIDYKKNMGGLIKSYDWDQMFDIVDYLKLWEGSWGVELKKQGLKRLSEVLSMRMDKEIEISGESFYQSGKESSFKNGSKWLNKFKIIRNNSSHEGSRGKGNGVNKEELNILRKMESGLKRINIQLS